MISAEDVAELAQLCERPRECSEFGRTYILLPSLRLPPGCTPAVVDGLLCVAGCDGYPTRLFFSEKVTSKNNLNWNSLNVPILQRTWNAYSWNYVIYEGRAIEVLAQHLKALR